MKKTKKKVSPKVKRSLTDSCLYSPVVGFRTGRGTPIVILAARQINGKIYNADTSYHELISICDGMSEILGCSAYRVMFLGGEHCGVRYQTF